MLKKNIHMFWLDAKREKTILSSTEIAFLKICKIPIRQNIKSTLKKIKTNANQ